MRNQKVDASRYPLPRLSPSSERLWRQLVPRRMRSLGRRMLFEETLRARDRVAEFRDLIATQGLTETTKSTGMVHLNPLVKAEKEARGLFAKLAGCLHLQWDARIDGLISDDDLDDEEED